MHYPIFVYGTLMTGEPAFTFLAAASLRHQPARLPGVVLHSTGDYPIATAAAPAIAAVDPAIWGEVHWLAAAKYSAVFAQLDAYEGAEYRRVLRRIELVATGSGEQPLDAWVYLGDAAYAAQYPIIAGGDWRKRAVHVGH